MANIPLPAELSHLKPNNRAGLLFLGPCIGLTSVAVVLSARESWIEWFTGQILLAVALTQWFVILHECGHETLFRRKDVNLHAGHLASLFCLIPFLCWKAVHGKHHKWTGWQDVDPTTALLVPDTFGITKKAIINICWKYWIPLFSVIYRVQNFWHLARLKRIFPRRDQQQTFVGNILFLLTVYVGLICWIGAGRLLGLVGFGFLLSFVFQDLLLLSQHTHVPLNLSRGGHAQPYPALQQEVFTRSLKFPAWFSAFVLLNVDAHELHHMYPFVPGYYLREIPYMPSNEIDWWRWIRQAKRLRGEVFLLQNRTQSGVRI